MASDLEYSSIGKLTRRTCEKFIARAMRNQHVPADIAKEFTDLSFDEASAVHAAETAEQRAQAVMDYATSVAMHVKEYVDATAPMTPLGYPYKVCTLHPDLCFFRH